MEAIGTRARKYAARHRVVQESRLPNADASAPRRFRSGGPTQLESTSSGLRCWEGLVAWSTARTDQDGSLVVQAGDAPPSPDGVEMRCRGQDVEYADSTLLPVHSTRRGREYCKNHKAPIRQRG